MTDDGNADTLADPDVMRTILGWGRSPDAVARFLREARVQPAWPLAQLVRT